MPGRDLNLLSLDGGGIRGLSSLQILKQLMETVALEAGLPNPPKPCDYFDMIGGTSTGGLLAIMLGRLKMDIEECIMAYADMSDRIFRKKHHRVNVRHAEIQGRFDSEELERSIKKIIRQQGIDEDSLLMDLPDAPCKVFVCATSTSTTETVHLTSYRRARGGGDRLRSTKIWEAARATSAASSFFDPINISMGSYKEEYVDGATGANNPIQELWNEAKDAWDPEPLEKNLKCLVSIGTGVPSVEPFRAGLLDIGDTLIRISTETEQTAESFQRAHSDLDEEGRYFRFNVRNGLEKIGLEDSSEKDNIMVITERYVQTQDVFKLMKLCGKCLAQREYATVSNLQLPGIPLNNAIVRRGVWQMRKHEDHDQPLSLLEKISAYDHEKVHRRLSRKRLKGTGQWFLETDQFKTWFTQERCSSLWCSGIVGSGKTMITTAVVEMVKDQALKSGNASAYFYCETAERQMLTAFNVLSSFVKQLLVYLSRIGKVYSEEIEHQLARLYQAKALEPDNEDITAIFSDIFIYIPGAVYVIDGLDELDQDEASQLLNLFRNLLNKSSGQKLFISSRIELGQNVDVVKLIPGTVQIPISQIDIVADIRHYVEAQIEERMAYTRKLTEDSSLILDIQRRLSSGAEGMFLWAQLQLSALWDDCFSDADILEALQNLPKGLTETYSRCLDRMQRHIINMRFGPKVLAWVCCAQRPLHIDELREAIAFDLDDSSWEASKIPSSGTVISCCANLVVLDPTDQHVRFAHPSVKQFLLENQKARYQACHIQQEAWQLSCGELCVNYLSFTDFGLQLQETGSVIISTDVITPAGTLASLPFGNLVSRARWPGRLTPRKQAMRFSLPRPTQPSIPPDVHRFKFLQYAVDYWTTHTKTITSQSSVWQKFKTLAIQPNRSWKIHPWLPGGQSQISHLHGLFGWSVQTAHIPLLDIVLSLDRNHLDFYNLPVIGNGFLALHIASRQGQLDVVSRLLKFCAINAVDDAGWASLHHAAAKGRHEIVSLLLRKYGIKVNLASKRGETPLWLASSRGHAECLRRLIAKRTDTTHEGPVGYTPLEIALQNGHEEVVRTLLSTGLKIDNAKAAYINAVDRDYKSPMKALLLQNLSEDDIVFTISFAVKTGNESLATDLLEQRSNLTRQCRDNHGNTLLHMSVQKQKNAIAKLLLSNGADIDSINDDFDRPLDLAISMGDKYLSQLLLNSGASIEQGLRVEQPLHTAIRLQHQSIVRQLIAHGANVNTLDSDFLNPLYLVCRLGNVELLRILWDNGAKHSDSLDNTSPLIVACQMGHLPIVQLLIAKGADGQVYGKSERALIVASRFAHEDIVKLLLDSGADVNGRDKNRGTALDACVSRNRQPEVLPRGFHTHERILQQLLQAGANVRAVNDKGQSALHCAVVWSDETMARLLLKAGADVNSVDNQGQTVLHIAVKHRDVRMAELLISHGIDIDIRDKQNRSPRNIVGDLDFLTILDRAARDAKSYNS